MSVPNEIPQCPPSPWRLFCAVAIGLLLGSASNAQAPADLGNGQLNERVTELVKQNQLVEARPFLMEMQTRGVDDPSIREPISYFLAASFLEEYKIGKDSSALEQAAQRFEKYLTEFPDASRATIAQLNLADAYVDLEQYEKAIAAYRRMYNKSSTSASVRRDLRRLMAQSYLKWGKAGDGIPIFLEAFQQSVLDPEGQAEAATWLAQGYLQRHETEKILPYFNHLTGSKAALFNPKFNVTIIKAGDRLFENKEYDYAILFYAIVKKKEDIIAFYEQTVATLELAVRYREPGTEEAVRLEGRLREAQANLKAVRSVRDYEADVRWRVARVYQDSNRAWEALWAFYNLVQDYPNHEQAEEFLFLAFSQARKINDYVMVVQLAKDYLARADFRKYRGQVTLDLATYYLENGYEQDFYDLATRYLDIGPEDDRVGSQLASLLGGLLIKRERFNELSDRMERYYNQYAHLDGLREASGYWRSLAVLLMADYPSGLEKFNQFLSEQGKRSAFYEDAFYRKGICLYGVQKADEAYTHLAQFVSDYPNSDVRGEAELYLGDLQREREAYGPALGHYRLVDSYTNRAAWVTKAVFAISEVLELTGQPEEAAAELTEYIATYDSQGELDEAYLRLGDIRQRQNRIAERFELHAEGLRRTASVPDRYAADQILRNYVEDHVRLSNHFVSAIRLIQSLIDDDAYRTTFLADRALQYQFFQSDEGAEVDPNLVHRLVRDRVFRRELKEDAHRVLRKELDRYEELAAGLEPHAPRLLFAELRANADPNKDRVLFHRLEMGQAMLDDISEAFPFPKEEVMDSSPAVVIWLAGIVREEDRHAASELLLATLKKHPFAPTRYEAMRLLAKISEEEAQADPSEANWSAALDYYDRIIERYGMRGEDGEQFIAKARILTELGRNEEALPLLATVIRNPQWRGIAHAQAHLRLGIANFELGRFAEAHGFFERLILGFAGFRDEVALAYLWDIKTLEKMGEPDSIEQLLTELRLREDLKDTKGYQKIQESYEL